MGVIDPSVKIHLKIKNERLGFSPNKEWDQALMEVYAAMIDSMDQNIGKVLKVLDDTGTAENTLILFISDNGACAETPGGHNNMEHIPGPKVLHCCRLKLGNSSKYSLQKAQSQRMKVESCHVLFAGRKNQAKYLD